MSRSTVHRQHAQRRGRRSEGVAAWWLRLKGYRILERDLRCPVGEIDLIAQRGATLAIIEVKARSAMADAAEAISGRQRHRIVAALGWYLQRRPEFAGARIRFDAVLIAPRRLPRHLAGCWEPPATG